jgi:hypothetical protein
VGEVVAVGAVEVDGGDEGEVVAVGTGVKVGAMVVLPAGGAFEDFEDFKGGEGAGTFADFDATGFFVWASIGDFEDFEDEEGDGTFVDFDATGFFVWASIGDFEDFEDEGGDGDFVDFDATGFIVGAGTGFTNSSISPFAVGALVGAFIAFDATGFIVGAGTGFFVVFVGALGFIVGGALGFIVGGAFAGVLGFFVGFIVGFFVGAFVLGGFEGFLTGEGFFARALDDEARALDDATESFVRAVDDAMSSVLYPAWMPKTTTIVAIVLILSMIFIMVDGWLICQYRWVKIMHGRRAVLMVRRALVQPGLIHTYNSPAREIVLLANFFVLWVFYIRNYKLPFLK